MKRSIIVCCALAMSGAGLAIASVPSKSAGKEKIATMAAASVRALANGGNEAAPIGRAQDRAVSNYKRNERRRAAAAKRERAKAAKANAVERELAKAAAAAAGADTKTGAGREREARALARAQDHAVASYKRNEKRRAAEAKREEAKMAAAVAKAAERARQEVQALARAQDRVVAYYKRSLGIGTDTVAKAVKRIEKLACFTGVQDRHARIGVQLVNGKVDYFAYYSKWKPRTCSIAAERNGPYSHWEERGGTLKVTLVDDKGAFTIDHKGGTYRFVFRNIDRMRYCGMSGKINGSLTVVRGKSSCVVQGVMDGPEG